MKSSKVHANTAIFEIERKLAGEFLVHGTPIDLEVIRSNGGLLTLRKGNKTFKMYCKKVADNTYDVWIKNYVIQVTIEDPAAQLLAHYQAQSGHQHYRMEIKAPMPGLVTNVAVAAGQNVEKDDKLLTLEAMKMENEIRSPMKGVVKKIEIGKGSKVEKEQRLIIIEQL